MKLDYKKFEDVRTFKVKIEGITPYMQNALDIESIYNPVNKVKPIHNPKNDTEKALYKNSKGIYVPERHVKSPIVKSATDYQWKGQKTYKDLVQSSVFVGPEEIPLNSKYVIDIRPEWIRNGSSKIPKPTARPRFDKWDLEFTLTILDGRIPNEVIPEILAGAGLRYGAGELHARGFGKFKVVLFEKIEQKDEKPKAKSKSK